MSVYQLCYSVSRTNLLAFQRHFINGAGDEAVLFARVKRVCTSLTYVRSFRSLLAHARTRARLRLAVLANLKLIKKRPFRGLFLISGRQARLSCRRASRAVQIRMSVKRTDTPYVSTDRRNIPVRASQK